jgi:hypothetical protein
MSRLLPFLALLAACSQSTEATLYSMTYDEDVAGAWSAVVTDTAGCLAGGNSTFSLALHFEPHAVPHDPGSSLAPDSYDVPMGSTWTAGARTGYMSGDVSWPVSGLFLGTGPWQAVAPRDTAAGAQLHAWFVFTAGTDSLYGDLYDPEGTPVDSLGSLRHPLFGPAGCVYQFRAAHIQ